MDTVFEVVVLVDLDVVGIWIAVAGFGLNGRFETGIGDAYVLLDGDAENDGRAD